MTKNIVKEMIIFLLLALAIILILGVLLYKYVPANKIIPEKVSYTTPENVKTELQTDENVDDSEVVVTYQIDSTDLSNYKKIQEYVPGKKFASVQQYNSTAGSNSNSGTTENSSSNNKSNTNTNSSTGSTTTTSSGSTNSGNGSSTTTNSSNSGYLPDKGTK